MRSDRHGASEQWSEESNGPREGYQVHGWPNSAQCFLNSFARERNFVRNFLLICATNGSSSECLVCKTVHLASHQEKAFMARTESKESYEKLRRREEPCGRRRAFSFLTREASEERTRLGREASQKRTRLGLFCFFSFFFEQTRLVFFVLKFRLAEGASGT